MYVFNSRRYSPVRGQIYLLKIASIYGYFTPIGSKMAILGYFLKKCQDKIPDTEVLKKAKMQSVHTKVAKRNVTSTPFKPRLRILIFQLSPGNKLLRIEQSGVATSTKVSPNLKQRESVKLKGSVKKGKQEPRDHHQTWHSPNSLALFATKSLEQRFAYTAINEHANTHKRPIFRI